MNSLTSNFPHPVDYLSPEGKWRHSEPIFFDTPEDAEKFWNELKDQPK